MIFANGYSMLMTYNTDPLGILYGSIAATWTTILLLGSFYLIRNRAEPCVRLRNITLTLSAVGVLHVYWILCLCAYILHGNFPCAVEFWIMCVYLPLGIALFHAANTQLLQVAVSQKQYLHEYTPLSEKLNQHTTSVKWQQYTSIFQSKDKVKKTVGYISAFMVLQLMCTLFIFTISRKFHPSFGLIGSNFDQSVDNSDQCLQPEDLCEAAKRIACRRGWEWIPSILWQFFWAWIYAPYLLWKLRSIKDIHGWRTQTIICCLAGLPASPLWLAALYIPKMHIVSRYYIPPMWFTPSIFIIEAVMVFVPCSNVLLNRRLEHRTEKIIAEWQKKRNGSAASLADGSTLADIASSHQGSAISTSSIYKGQMYTMEALETTLRQNHQPLLHFASLRDFSGENISFLVRVMNWKIDWSPPSPLRSNNKRKSKLRDMKTDNLRRYQFEQALDIYTSFVSLKYSNYSINLSSPQYKQLEDIFEETASILHGSIQTYTDAVTPFNDIWTAPLSLEVTGIRKMSSKDGMSTTSTIVPYDSIHSTDNASSSQCELLAHSQTYQMSQVGRKSLVQIGVPDGFNSQVFDAAEESIKYMVLTNTWCKFVKASESQVNKKTLVQQVRSICA